YGNKVYSSQGSPSSEAVSIPKQSVGTSGSGGSISSLLPQPKMKKND
ncbi:MAG: hypothetical protein ACI920_001201, partial [Saprospiraceae bacterium]